MTPRTVIVLDFDGVLTRLDVDWADVKTKFHMTFGIDVQEISDFWQRNPGPDLFLEASHFVEKFELEAVQEAPLYPDVKRLFEWFDGTTYIASMQSRTCILRFLDRFSLESRIQRVLAREEFGTKQEELKHILAKEKGNRMIFVDNSLSNVKLARESGMASILFDRASGADLSNLLKSYLSRKHENTARSQR